MKAISDGIAFFVYHLLRSHKKTSPTLLFSQKQSGLAYYLQIYNQ